MKKRERLEKDMSAGVKAPTDGSVTLTLAVKLGVVINIGLDPGETLSGRSLKGAILGNAVERVEIGDKATTDIAFDDLIDAVSVVEAYYDPSGEDVHNKSPLKPADVSLLSDRDHTWQCDNCHHQMPWQPGNRCDKCGTWRWPEPADAAYWMTRLDTSSGKGINYSRAKSMLKQIMEDAGWIKPEPERPSEAAMRTGKERREAELSKSGN